MLVVAGWAGPLAVTLSAAEYLATSEDRPRHTELIHGTVVVREPKLPHLRAQLRLAYHLQRWIDEADDRGYVSLPADIPIDDANVFAPDLWWVSEDRRPTEDQLDLEGLPDLVVEIRSPSTWARDLAVKLPAYEAGGVAEAWYLDTQARAVLIFRRANPGSPSFEVTVEVGADHELTSPLLAGFTIRVGSIFQL